MAKKKIGTLFERDPEMAKNFYKAISLGLSISKACDLVGISNDVIYSWFDKAKIDKENNLSEEDSFHIKFEKEYKKNRSMFQVRNLSRIDEASKGGSWQASAWLLERRCPDEFALKTNVNLENDTITVIHDIPQTDD